MAVHQADGRTYAPASVKPMTSLAYGAGAVTSLALVLAVGVWGYKLVMRDVSGVPVVRVAEGPMRVMPEDPGGSPAENQGLAVNKVAAEGVAEKPADRLILAPRPVDLAIEDSATAKLDLIRLTRDLGPEAAEKPNTPASNDGAKSASDTASDTGPSTASTTAGADAPAEPEAPVQTAALAAKAAVVPVAAPAKSTVGLAESLRPRLRPEGLSLAAAAAIAAPPPVQITEVDPDSLAVGTRLAQLGAFESATIARKEWDRLSGRFGEFLEDKQRVIQKAESGGRTFYRLRAYGFADISDARRFCSALVAERAECIPVTIK